MLKKAVFFLFWTAVLFAQEDGIPQERSLSGPVTSIEIFGLKRTKRHVAMYPLEQFLSREAETLDINEVHAAVKDTGILESKTIELVKQESGIVLQVTVQEKWSFFPVPLILGGSGDTSYGLFLADTNAFGLRDQAAIGGLYNSSFIMGMVLYNHTPNRKNSFGWNTAFMFEREENKDVNSKEKLERRYSTDTFRYSLGLYYPFAGSMTGSAHLSYANIMLKENIKAINEPASGVSLINVTPGFAIRYSDWDGYLLSQKTVSLEYSFNYVLSGASFHKVSFRAVYEQSIIPGFRLGLKSGAVASSASNPLFEDDPHRAQVDILPMDYSALHYAGFSAGLEKYLLKLAWGTLSVLGSWQCVFSQGPVSDNKVEFNHGPFGGIRFFLSRLAIPALGMGLAYNMTTGIYQFSFSVGMGF